MKRIIISAITGILLLSISGCVKDDIEIDTERLTKFDRPMNLAGPIANVKLNASDLLGRLSESLSDYILTDEDGLLYVRYTDSINIAWDDIVKLESVTHSENYSIIIPPGLSTIDGSITFEERIKLNEKDNQRLDSMIIESSILNLDINFPAGLSGEILISFPEISNNGEILEITYDSSNPESHFERDLEGYFVRFKQGVDSSYISMLITPENISGSEGSFDLGVTLALEQTVPEIIFGRFGADKVINENNNLEFNFFKNLNVLDMVEFKDLQLEINFESYYGIPYQCIIDSAITTSSTNNDSVELEFAGNSNILNINSANYGTEIIPAVNNIIYNNSNSNILEALEILPDNMNYHVEVNTNPEDSNALNFVTGDNKINGDLDVIIPIWFKCQTYERTDTIQSFNVDSIFTDNIMEFLDSATLTFDIKNYFPFELKFQVYAATENYQIVDSLFSTDQQFLESGTLDDSDKIVEPGITEDLDITLSKDKIEKFKELEVKKLLIYSKIATVDNETRFVKLFEDTGFEFKLSFEIKSSELN